VPGSPADNAGILAKDIILEVNGMRMESSRVLSSLVAETAVGKTVEILLLRGGLDKKLTVEIGRMNDKDFPIDSQNKKTEEGLGLEVSELTEEFADEYNLSESCGVIVLDVEPDSKGDKAGIMHGDIIKEINHYPVKSLGDFNKILGEIKSGEQIQMFIKRSNIGFIVVRITR
jgi:serine protease Do